MVANYRVSLDFASYSDADLDEFSGNVITSLTGSVSFPTPPVTLANLTTLNLNFHNAVLAALPGGIQLTAAKNAAKVLLLDGLRKEATYVQGIASHNLEVLLTSGFYATSTNRAQAPLAQPVIMELENLATTQLLARVTPLTNAKAYQVQTIAGTSAWLDVGTYTQARRVVLSNLTPGIIYQVRVRGIGGSTGYSDWSNPVSLMAT